MIYFPACSIPHFAELCMNGYRETWKNPAKGTAADCGVLTDPNPLRAKALELLRRQEVDPRDYLIPRGTLCDWEYLSYQQRRTVCTGPAPGATIFRWLFGETWNRRCWMMWIWNCQKT